MDFKKPAIKEVNGLRARLVNRKKELWKAYIGGNPIQQESCPIERRSTQSSTQSTEPETERTVIPSGGEDPEEPEVFETQGDTLAANLTGLLDNLLALPLAEKPEVKESVESLSKSFQSLSAQVEINTQKLSSVLELKKRNYDLTNQISELDGRVSDGLNRIVNVESKLNVNVGNYKSKATKSQMVKNK